VRSGSSPSVEPLLRKLEAATAARVLRTPLAHVTLQ
jgi:hypothetical protein